MGACGSSAALEPADLTVDGAAPVYWSPEVDRQKRAAKLRETQEKQQAEIERATGHLRRNTAGRRSTGSKSAEEEKQQTDDGKLKEGTVQSTRPSRASRHASASLPSPTQQPAMTEAELSDFPLPKSARRHARAVSASTSSVGSTRSPEVSVSVGTAGGEVDVMSTPRQYQSTPMASRRTSMMPEAVKEDNEERQVEEEKVSEASAPQSTAAPTIVTSSIAATTAAPAIPLRPVPSSAIQRVEKVESGPAAGNVGAVFGVQLRKAPTPVKVVDMTVVPSAATTA